MCEAAVLVRPATAADLPAAAALVTGQALFEQYGISAHGLLTSLESALVQSQQVLVATQEDRVAGLAWFQLRGGFARSGYLRLLLTDQELQGRGIGSRLLAHVEEAVFNQGNDMFLLTNTENSAARRFYARQGYSEVGMIPDYVSPGLDEVILYKKRPALAAVTVL